MRGTLQKQQKATCTIGVPELHPAHMPHFITHTYPWCIELRRDQMSPEQEDADSDQTTSPEQCPHRSLRIESRRSDYIGRLALAPLRPLWYRSFRTYASGNQYARCLGHLSVTQYR